MRGGKQLLRQAIAFRDPFMHTGFMCELLVHKHVHRILVVACEAWDIPARHDLYCKRIAVDEDLDALDCEDPFDSIVMPHTPEKPEKTRALLARLTPKLEPCGTLRIITPIASREAAGQRIDALDPLLRAAKLERYGICATDPDESTGACILIVIGACQGYDPISHARQRFRAGRPDEAIEILYNVPPERYTDDTGMLVRLAVEKQLCYLAWGSKAENASILLYSFSHAQEQFFQAIALEPLREDAYIYHAEFWRRIGNDDMADRVLRSRDYASPSEAVRSLLANHQGHAKPVPTVEEAPALAAGEGLQFEPGESKTPRILIVTHENSDCATDVLYDGLCRLYGPDAAVEYPWKPFLHGECFGEAVDYPCTFDHPGQARPLEQITQELRQGRYDLILYCDMFHFTSREAVHAILDAGKNIPLFLVDTWDEPTDNRVDNLEFLDRKAVEGIFKREMLTCFDYGPDVWPLPLAYADGNIPSQIAWERDEELFWAGHRHFGMRHLFLETIERHLGRELNQRYSQEQYCQALAKARIGLDMFGNGYGTMRYFEIPAHGLMLLAERTPIRIPHDFRDGESAVFYDDLQQLVEKLDYYRQRPGDALRIAQAGHECLKRHHTGSARARDLLGRIAQRLQA